MEVASHAKSVIAMTGGALVGGCGRWGRVKVRGMSSKAAPAEVGISVGVDEPAGAERHELAVEVVGVLCRRLGGLAGVAG